MTGSTTKKTTISIIAAVGKNTRAIGKNNGLIWKIKGDLPRFKALTTGHPIIMGRKTFESIGKPLPDRTNIVISRNTASFPGTITVSSLEEAFSKAQGENSEEFFVIGGAEIYKQALPFTDKLYLTIVESDESGDAFFPEYREFKKIIQEERHDEHNPPFSYIQLTRT